LLSILAIYDGAIEHHAREIFGGEKKWRLIFFFFLKKMKIIEWDVWGFEKMSNELN
jgi:hypothetical protein